MLFPTRIKEDQPTEKSDPAACILPFPAKPMNTMAHNPILLSIIKKYH
jgi:hypothetical protein